jgi:ribosomal-protein-alanine N-acetyltransferase
MRVAMPWQGRDDNRCMELAAFPTLHTQRLTLREIVDSDAPALLAVHGDTQHMRWFGTDPVPDLAAAQKLVDTFAGWRLQPNPGTRWGLELQGTPGLVGSCGLFGWNRAWRRCMLGYELARGHTGQGLMHEALQAVLDWGFATMDLHRIEALVHPDNAPSLALLARLGFAREGRLREIARWGGQQHDMLQLALLRADWVARGAAPAAPAAQPAAEDAAFFQQLETTRTAALVARELPAIERLHAPEYQLVTPSGRVFTRERYMAAIAAAPFYAAWEHGPMQVQATAEMAAVRYPARLVFPSGKVMLCWHLDVYRLQAGAWRAVMSQATERPAD